VYQFFQDGSNERVREWVPGPEAVKAFQHYTSSVAARIGMVLRVIITDSGDMIAAEWEHGKGVTFPPPPSATDNGHGNA
jgi:hypothetical protein